MDLQIVCRDVMDDVDGSLGCVLTDIETGLPLAAECRPGTVMDENTVALVSNVGIDLFRGKLVRKFGHSLSRDHSAANGFVHEVQLTTSNTYQFMSSVPGWDQVIFILVTDKNVSLGMGLLAVHDAVRRLGETPARPAAPPAVDPIVQPRAEALERASNSQWQTRQPEPRHDGDLVARGARIEPQPEPLAETLARTSVTPETRPVRAPAPEIAPEEPSPRPSESPELPVEAPRAAAQAKEAADSESRRYYRGAAMGDSETETSTPSAVPAGPRARMFFKRADEDKKTSRRRRS